MLILHIVSKMTRRENASQENHLQELILEQTRQYVARLDGTVKCLVHLRTSNSLSHISASRQRSGWKAEVENLGLKVQTVKTKDS